MKCTKNMRRNVIMILIILVIGCLAYNVMRNDSIDKAKANSNDYMKCMFEVTDVTETGIQGESLDQSLVNKDEVGMYLDKQELNYIDLDNIKVGDIVEVQIWSAKVSKGIDNIKDVIVIN